MRIRLIAAFVIGVGFGAVGGADADPLPIVTGVGQVSSPGGPGAVYPLSAAWAPVAAGDDDATFPSTFSLARDYGLGRVVVIGHDGIFGSYGTLDNGRFLRNVVAWLDQAGAKQVKYTTGHAEWVTAGSFASLQTGLAPLGYTFGAMAAPISPAQLASTSVLIVGNAWGTFTAAEIDAVQQWVGQGGGLFLVGLGWSWEPYHPGTTLEDYPMMQLAVPYDVRWLRGAIEDPTNNLNGAPIFHTFYPNIPVSGTPDAMALIDAEHAAHGSALAADLESDGALRQRFVRAHQMLAIPATEFPDGHPNRQAVFDYLADLVTRQPASYARLAPFDETAVPTATRLRERFLRTWYDAVEPTGAVISLIASGAQMTGRRREIFEDFGIILLDNQRLDAEQLDYIHTYFALLPPGLEALRAISVGDYLGSPPISVPLVGAGQAVSIFGDRIGGYSENSFPDDVPPGIVDGFSIVVAHEANHVVDAHTIAPSPTLAARRAQLLTDAGDDQLNYLRSMIDSGFFTAAPQEFFASIANQWFADSAKTVRLGIVRFDAGRHDPINQALFFAEVYSQGGNTTYFYSTDIGGHIARTTVPVHRNADGFIDGITADGVDYHFALDSSGRVIAYDNAQPSDPCAGAPDMVKPSLRLGTFASGPGDDVIRLKGVALSVSAFDPVANGLALLVEDASGRTLIDAAIPGGVYDPVTQVGWQVRNGGANLRFSSATRVGKAVTRVSLRLDPHTPGRVSIKVLGTRGSYASPPVELPVEAKLILDPTGRQCAVARFEAPPLACKTSRSGSTVTCK